MKLNKKQVYKLNQTVIYQIVSKKGKGKIVDFKKDYFDREIYRVKDYKSNFEVSILEEEIIRVCENNIKKL